MRHWDVIWMQLLRKYNMVFRLVITSAQKKNQEKILPNVPFWNDELQRLRRITKFKRKSYQQAINPELTQRRLNKCREIKGVYGVKIEDRKRKCWQAKVCERSLGYRSMGEFL